VLAQRRGNGIEGLCRRLPQLSPHLSHRHSAFLSVESSLEDGSVAEFRRKLLSISDVPHLNRDQPKRL
jgi:hypothetical protein